MTAEAAGSCLALPNPSHCNQLPPGESLGRKTTPVLVARGAEEDGPDDAAFRRIVVVGAPAQGRDAATRYAHGLAGTFGGALVEHLPACTEEEARRRACTLIVVARSGQAESSVTAERLVRSCELPMLFVPEGTGAARTDTRSSFLATRSYKEDMK